MVAKLSVSIDEGLAKWLDDGVRSGSWSTRSEAVAEGLEALRLTQAARRLQESIDALTDEDVDEAQQLCSNTLEPEETFPGDPYEAWRLEGWSREELAEIEEDESLRKTGGRR